MNLSSQEGVARLSRGLLRTVLAMMEWVATAVRAARSWQWGVVFGRITLAALGLVILGAIGRSALARNLLASEPPASPDAGVSLPPPPPSSLPGRPASVASASAPPGVSTGLATPPDTASMSPPLAAALPPPAAEAARGHATPEDPVFLNQATLADLHRLPGVGPKRAEAILTLRNRLGHFRQIEDLLKVKGIGRSSLKKLRPLVRLDPPPQRIADAATG